MNHAIHTAVRRARNARIATSTALAAALSIVLLTLSVVPAQAGGIDATINSITAPAAVWVGKVVFFKIPLFGAQLPLVVLWLVVGAYGLMFRLIRTRAATRVSALQYFAPPVTMLIALPVFGEALTINGLAGLLVTSAGFWLMARGAAKRG